MNKLFEEFKKHVQKCFDDVWTGSASYAPDETFLFDAEKYPPQWLMEQFKTLDCGEFYVWGGDYEEEEAFSFSVRPDYDNSVFTVHFGDNDEQVWGLCVQIRPEVRNE